MPSVYFLPEEKHVQWKQSFEIFKTNRIPTAYRFIRTGAGEMPIMFSAICESHSKKQALLP